MHGSALMTNTQTIRSKSSLRDGERERLVEEEEVML